MGACIGVLQRGRMRHGPFGPNATMNGLPGTTHCDQGFPITPVGMAPS
jgi:hypothetical protein